MKTYLGDAVYMRVDDWGCIVLTTENGVRTTNEIVLEPEVWEAMCRELARYKAQLRAAEARERRHIGEGGT